MMIKGQGIKKGHNLHQVSFNKKRGKAQKVFKQRSHTRLAMKERLHYLVNRTNGENCRCHHTWFTVSSLHKALTLISNKTPHFR
ncbi:hypothetical protein H5410_060886 [Solanum commersonii]|uniref:Uncharacterized protein n=1 Tax=Solanum commersonii TaxID=4109 RepID=A0A9J5W7F7_SOLCO|nr:hypothetical protein H5410_060886 [Solanum commersonii]